MADDHGAAPEFTRSRLLAAISAPTDPDAYRAWVREGLDDLAAGRVISGERVSAWVRSLGTDDPLPPPECD